MTLESFAYLAEIVGVVGLIASLLYVGKQVQLNREQLKAGAEGQYYAWADHVFSRISLDRDFAEVWNKGATGLADLDEVDRERIVNHEIGALYMWHQFYLMLQKGVLPSHVEAAFDWSLRGIGNRQSMREAWKVAKPGFDESFRQFVSEYLE